MPHLRLFMHWSPLKNGKVSEAKKTLLKLVEEGQHANEAHFILAHCRTGDGYKTAILEYRQVERGGNYFNALARAAFPLTEAGKDSEAQALFAEARQSSPSSGTQDLELEINRLTELNRIDDALALCRSGTECLSDSHSLLYVGRDAAGTQGQFEGMERDLRAILRKTPKRRCPQCSGVHFALVDRTDRLDEAPPAD